MQFRFSRSGGALSRTVVLSAALAAAIAAPAGAQTAQTGAPKTAPAAKPDAALPSARQIIDRHIEAIGGRKAILAHTSSYSKGTLSIPANGMSGSVDVYAAKPNKSLLKISIAGIGEVVEGFDGVVGWSMSPMTGPALSDGKVLADKKFDSDFYGDLHDDARYSSMKTVEKTTFDGRPCYKISLTRKGATTEDFEYYDIATGLKAGASGTRETPMGAVPSTQVQSDYKKFGDLLVPTTLKFSTMGVDQVFTFTSVELDKVDPAVFELPAQIKALIK